MKRTLLPAAAAILAAAPAAAQDAHADAVAFGARPAVVDASLSPDGGKLAYLAPGAGQSATLVTIDLAAGDAARPALRVDGAPDRLSNCRFVSDARLLCTVWGLVKVPELTRPLTYSRSFAVDAGGGNQKLLTEQAVNRTRTTLFGGSVVDWLPGTDGAVLMMRDHAPTDTIGTNIGTRTEGFGVDRIDTRTGRAAPVEPARRLATEYITDGKGVVRIAGYASFRGETGQLSSTINYSYRPAGSREWVALGPYDSVTDAGFNPYAVDPALNVVYGFRKRDGRLALYARKLDASAAETLIGSHPDVDVDSLVRIGRSRRVVGYSYVVEKREVHYFDPAASALVTALGRALPATPQIDIVDASADETKLLIHAGADNNGGRYYLFDKAAKSLRPLMDDRPELAGRTLASVTPVRIKVADGSTIPGYLTLPPNGPRKGLPAIVMPHGGPTARDEWGFDWLPQFYAARGFAVLQPNYRGSAGYGDAHLMQNGFRAWRTAIGDVLDAGRWLAAEGIADPAKLSIVGWSYGGYAALEAAALDPKLFKAVVAVAPVTSLPLLVEERRYFATRRIVEDILGSQPPEASPAANAARIAAPVLLAHGTLDANVGYGQSTLMATRLKAAGKRVELLTFEGLDHGLDDAAARTRLLERSDAFLREAIGG